MTAVDLGRLGAWGHLDSLSIDAARAYARRVDELGYGTIWVPETVGREPFTLLGLLAGETSEILLGTSIVGIWGHDPQTTRMAAQTLQEATGGRFVLGLGVSHPHLAERLRGHTYDRPLTRMREYLAAYRAAIYKGPMADGAGEPPLLIAAIRERMLRLAATDADGAFPYLVTAKRLAWMRGVLDEAAVGRERRPILAVTMPAVLEVDLRAARTSARAYLAPYLRTPAYQASWREQGFAEADWE
jgi:probable F420-dependent oxidoreductase